MKTKCLMILSAAFLMQTSFAEDVVNCPSTIDINLKHACASYIPGYPCDSKTIKITSNNMPSPWQIDSANPTSQNGLPQGQLTLAYVYSSYNTQGTHKSYCSYIDRNSAYNMLFFSTNGMAGPDLQAEYQQWTPTSAGSNAYTCGNGLISSPTPTCPFLGYERR